MNFTLMLSNYTEFCCFIFKHLLKIDIRDSLYKDLQKQIHPVVEYDQSNTLVKIIVISTESIFFIWYMILNLACNFHTYNHYAFCLLKIIPKTACNFGLWTQFLLINNTTIYMTLHFMFHIFRYHNTLYHNNY